MQYYNIAGFKLSVETFGKSICFPSFAPFEVCEGEVDFRIELSDETIPITDYEKLGEWGWFESHCSLYRRGENFIWNRVDDIDGEVSQIRWKGFCPTYFEYCSSPRRHVVELLLLVAFNYATLPFGTLILHSSVVENGGKGYLFLGESGTGKSTHTKLWLKHIEGSELLNDDGPAARIIDGEVVVCGTPWSGKGCIYRNASVPIGGIYRLSQAPYNKLTKLNNREAFAAIVHSAMPPFMVCEEHADMAMATLSGIIAGTDKFHLACLPDEEAAKLSFSRCVE
ncbi:hypothetical protein BN938_2274 [Mucinivorans hirudinis]|uniref:Phosphoenolpyruvate carboxykinase n=1 Tax=Mucinivorans hirudinis TaxID=1433126 RepID=A0A060R9Q6_9BACT|nr:hypothetical protein BN938_2274 [Mucinivorans hirudinis]